MKKMSFLIVGLLLSFGAFADEVNLKVGLNLNQDLEAEIKYEEYVSYDDSYLSGTESGDLKTKSNLFFSGEYLKSINDNLLIGGGISLENDLKVDDELKIKYTPIYATIKNYFPTKNQNISPYISGNLGINLFETSLEGDEEVSPDTNVSLEDKSGLFFGINAGIKFNNNAFVELSFKQSNGSVEELWSYAGSNDEFKGNYEKITADTKVNRVSLNVGYSFGL